MSRASLPDSSSEKARYETHNNDVEDPRYRAFVSPIVEAVATGWPTSAKGLDFGAGTGPVISVMLGEKGYDMQLYDPFFHPSVEPLRDKYHFIACCEVIEHFHDPAAEFQRLHDLLLPGGTLYCMTDILTEEVNFSSWYYTNDPTHVIFYRPETFEWIAKRYGFAAPEIDGRLIALRRLPVASMS